MEFNALSGDLLKELQLAQSVVEKKTTMPILGFVRVVAADGFVTMTATDLEVGLISKFVAEVIKPGEALLFADQFYRYLSLTPVDANFNLKTGPNGIHYRWNKASGRFPIIDEGTYPELPTKPSEAVSLPVGSFIDSVPSVDFAIDHTDTRFTIAGMLLHLLPGEFRLHATNGHEQALSSHQVDYDGKELKTIIPLKAVSAIKKIFDDNSLAEPILFYPGNKYIFLEYGNRVMFTRSLEHKYPNYMIGFPNGETDNIEVEADNLSDAISRVALFADDRSRCVKFDFSNDIVNVSASTLGDSNESVYADMPSDMNRVIGFRSDYILDFLKVASGKRVKLMMAGNNIMEGRIIGDSSYRFAVASMGIQG